MENAKRPEPREVPFASAGGVDRRRRCGGVPGRLGTVSPVPRGGPSRWRSARVAGGIRLAYTDVPRAGCKGEPLPGSGVSPGIYSPGGVGTPDGSATARWRTKGAGPDVYSVSARRGSMAWIAMRCVLLRDSGEFRLVTPLVALFRYALRLEGQLHLRRAVTDDLPLAYRRVAP